MKLSGGLACKKNNTSVAQFLCFLHVMHIIIPLDLDVLTCRWVETCCRWFVIFNVKSL